MLLAHQCAQRVLPPALPRRLLFLPTAVLLEGFFLEAYILHGRQPAMHVFQVDLHHLGTGVNNKCKAEQTGLLFVESLQLLPVYVVLNRGPAECEVSSYNSVGVVS